ncbi:MAG: DNA polymerase III subunit alpha [Flavobacteriales bacterium]|nr:DNA polymerase III subunit alpha [Flavobacteriales bacterium]
MYLIFDTETTGLPQNWKAPLTDFNNWPRMVQLAWQMHDSQGKLIDVKNFIIKPEGYDIPYNAEKIHGISTDRANKQGVDLKFVLHEFIKDVESSKFVVGHNVEFDNSIVGCELLRKNLVNLLADFPCLDTMKESTNYCEIPGGRGGNFKWPSLTDLHEKLFGEAFAEAHNASADVEATTRCFLELVRLQVISTKKSGLSESEFEKYKELNPKSFQLLGLDTQPYQDLKNDEQNDVTDEIEEDSLSPNSFVESTDSPFSHLHLHSQYSVLQASTNINLLADKAVEMKMPAVAITDMHNMFGVFKFINAVLGHKINKERDEGEDLKLKPIIGCELSVCKNHTDKSVKDFGFQQVFLCKNKKGYHNLSKLSSHAFVDGFYYIPRIDKELILKYKEDLIVLSGSNYGEIPNLILNVGESQAEEAFVWWHKNFGDDFYVELMRHHLDEEKHVNRILLKFARKYGVKVIATNNVFYLNKEDANAHDVLLCVKDGELQSTPIGKGRGYRHGFPNDEFYFKSQDEMKELFSDIPESIDNISEIVDKIESFTLKRDVLLPAFDIPDKFVNPEDEKDGGKRGENAYLKHLTYEGAKQRYEELTKEITDRIDFELKTIESSGYPGYFLIVQDFIYQARKMKVSVGPGRGSAAGSVVAYCTKITNVDPIKYELLFERFLNPERVSLPDIDIDFDDEGRGRVIDWVVHKYGFDQVSQIITYGTMAAKSSIRDTARVLDLPLDEAGKIANLVPDLTSLKKLFNYNDKQLIKKINSDQIVNAKQLIELSDKKGLSADTVRMARKLEGSVRNVGTHACGVIITPEPLVGLIPMTTSKDADLLVTQFDNSVVEIAGLLKMDFLGLTNLSIIKDCIKIIKEIHGVEIDIDTIPLDDQKTYGVFQRGETVGIFQFSSDGMRKHLKVLKPDTFEDLIAMNALYRPGPMGYIPEYIDRKHGKSKVVYELPEMEEYLKDTYGITVYQEQVMLLSQKLGGFTKGEADVLRKGMGKKDKPLIAKLKPKFFEGCEKNNLDLEIVEKVWSDWEKFTEYAFNKSHSTCYSLIAYQTAYLKAHYPAELMAALLTSNMNNIKKVTIDMEECKRIGVRVLGPDVNESFYKFAVNKKGEIRFGLGAVKGVGEAAVRSIVTERKENGPYASLEDFVSRVDLRSANKRTLDSIAVAGGFDSFNIYRSQIFAKDEHGTIYLEKMMKFGSKVQSEKDSTQIDMFGEIGESNIQSPTPPEVEPWGTMELLSKEKEVVGVYISGHPLDDYQLEIENFCNSNFSELESLEAVKGKSLKFAGVVTKVEHRESRNGKKFGTVYVEDYHDSYRLMLFGSDYTDFKNFLQEGWILHIRGMVQNRQWGDTDQLEFKISKIELLSEVIDSESRNMILEVSVDEIDNKMINTLVENIQKSKGEHTLIVRLIDYKNSYSVDLLSRKNKVSLDKNTVEELKKINGVEVLIKS